MKRSIINCDCTPGCAVPAWAETYRGTITLYHSGLQVLLGLKDLKCTPGILELLEEFDKTWSTDE